MKIKPKPFISNVPIHPGVTIKEILDERGIGQREFSRKNKIDVSMLNKIIKGKKNITAAWAVFFADRFGIPANFFLNLQANYHLARIRKRKKDEHRLRTL